jgi:cell division septation protein DedD
MKNKNSIFNKFLNGGGLALASAIGLAFVAIHWTPSPACAEQRRPLSSAEARIDEWSPPSGNWIEASLLIDRNYSVQVAALRSADKAWSLWSRIDSQTNGRLRPFEVWIEPIRRNDLETLYRLRLGRFESEWLALRVCREINLVEPGCFVVPHVDIAGS